VDKDSVSLVSYYGTAIPRSFWAGWDWAIAQGLLLTIFLGLGAVVCGSLFAVIRAMRRSHSWADAMESVWRLIADFFLAGIGAIVAGLISLFVYFFIQDAPQQISALTKRVEELTPKPTQPVTREFYSNRQRNEIADKLQDLTKQLDGYQAAIEPHVQKLTGVVSPFLELRIAQDRRMGNLHDPTGPTLVELQDAQSEISNIQASLTDFREAVFGQNGSARSIAAIAPQLAEQLFGKQEFNAPTLLIALNECNDAIAAARQYGNKYQDIELIVSFIRLSPCFHQLQESWIDINRWIIRTKDIINSARGTL
jgi:hypothetical protein